MTTPQDLADRLEKAIEALIAASLQILHHDGRDGDEVDVYERAQLRKAFTPILASLRRSAPASVTEDAIERCAIEINYARYFPDGVNHAPNPRVKRTAVEQWQVEDRSGKSYARKLARAALRSAPASGEMREAVEAEREACAETALSLKVRKDVYLTQRDSDRNNTCEFVARAIRARTPSGETREEVGSNRKDTIK